MEIIYLGHSFFMIEVDRVKILIDPFVSGNASFPQEWREAIQNADYILLTHAHGDHIGDTISLVNREKTTVIAVPEITTWLASKGVSKSINMNLGGTVHLQNEIAVTMVRADHSSSVVDQGTIVYGGVAAGFIIRAEDQSVYHFGDTDIFSDMALVHQFHQPRIGLIPIGGHYTMAAEAAAYACNHYFNFEKIIPMHYNTFPVIVADVQQFAKLVEKGEVVALAAGKSLSV